MGHIACTGMTYDYICSVYLAFFFFFFFFFFLMSGDFDQLPIGHFIASN